MTGFNTHRDNNTHGMEPLSEQSEQLSPRSDSQGLETSPYLQPRQRHSQRVSESCFSTWVWWFAHQTVSHLHKLIQSQFFFFYPHWLNWESAHVLSCLLMWWRLLVCGTHCKLMLHYLDLYFKLCAGAVWFVLFLNFIYLMSFVSV